METKGSEGKLIAKFGVNNRSFLIKRPTKKIKDEIDLLYSKTFFKYVRQGVCTHAEIMKIIKEQGIWTEENEREREGLVRDILALEDEIKSLSEQKDKPPEKTKELEAKCSQLTEMRQKLINLNMTVQGILSNTSEQKARDTVYMYYIFSSLYETDREKTFFNIFSTFEGFMDYIDGLMALEDEELDERQALERKLITEAMVHLIGWTSDVSVEEIRNPLEVRVLAETKKQEEAKKAEIAKAEETKAAEIKAAETKAAETKAPETKVEEPKPKRSTKSKEGEMDGTKQASNATEEKASQTGEVGPHSDQATG
jgi:hypothetical protein